MHTHPHCKRLFLMLLSCLLAKGSLHPLLCSGALCCHDRQPRATKMRLVVGTAAPALRLELTGVEALKHLQLVAAADPCSKLSGPLSHGRAS